MHWEVSIAIDGNGIGGNPILIRLPLAFARSGGNAGSGMYYDATNGQRTLFVCEKQGGTQNFYLVNTFFITNTLQAGDVIRASGTYEAAA